MPARCHTAQAGEAVQIIGGDVFQMLGGKGGQGGSDLTAPEYTVTMSNGEKTQKKHPARMLRDMQAEATAEVRGDRRARECIVATQMAQRPHGCKRYPEIVQIPPILKIPQSVLTLQQRLQHFGEPAAAHTFEHRRRFLAGDQAQLAHAYCIECRSLRACLISPLQALVA
jgi:hypothetical protein